MDKQAADDAFEIAVDFTPAPDPQPAPPTDPEPAASDPIKDAPASATEDAPVTPGKRARLSGLRASLPLLLAGLATFAALVATIGLIVVSRNVAETNQRIAALQAALEKAAPPAAASVHAGSVPTAPIAAPMAGPADKPASIEEVRALLFALRKDMVSYETMDGNAGWVKAVRDAQAELANRLSIVAEKVDRIDRRLSPRPEAH